ncbi:MAG: AMP-binding protein, partial [Solirubrobacteraceae bacterium]
DDLPVRERTLPAIWARRVRASEPDAPLLWFPGRATASVGELDCASEETAAGLAERGIEAGARVCLVMANSPELLVTMVALWKLGAVAVPLSPRLEGRLLEEKIAEVRPALVVADAAQAHCMPAGAPLLLAYAGRLASIRRPGARAPERELRPEQPALILFTSGSSGRSKGCVISHHYASYYAWVFWRHMGYTARDTLYTCLPLNHCHALFSSFWPAVLAGARIAISPRFSASRFWQEIAESEATACAAIGTMTSILLAREPDAHEAAQHVRIAHVSPDGALDMPRFQERFGCRTVTCLYGSTEAMIFPPLPEMPPVPGLIGPAPADWDVALLDEAGFELEGEATGELVARPRIAHTMFDGYFELAEPSACALRGAWLHTGDLVRRDRSGMFWFVGRRSDTIRRRGENVSAWEVERGVAEHPLVAEAAAFPVASVLDGEAVGLVVVRRAGSGLDVAAVSAHCERTLPRHMRPDRVWVRERALPKNAGGKPDKAGLRSEYADAAAG